MSPGINALSTLDFDVVDHVATVTLNRPEQLNSFNEQMASELVAVWSTVRDERMSEHSGLRSSAPTATGRFCTGIDVSEGVWWYRKPIFNQEDPGTLLGPKANKVWKPVIAALHGMVAGGAMYFVNEADFSICAESAQFLIHTPTPGSSAPSNRWGCLPSGCPMAR